MSKKTVFRSIIVTAILGSGFGSWSCRGEASVPPQPVVVAYAPFESTALLWVARDQGFFAGNGLDISLLRYETGAASLSGVLNGEADIVVGVTEFPAVRMAFQKQNLAIVGSADKGEYIYLIGRKDREIAMPSDLKGKRVGTTLGTIAEFYLGRFLELNGVKKQDITLIDLKTQAEWVNAVVNGDVDAVVIAQPDVSTVMESLGANGFTWPVQSGQILHGLIISTGGWINGHSELAAKFLKSLVQAEEYVARKPAEAKAMVRKGLNLDEGYMDTVWRQNQFSVSLDQTLILAMEDEARWMISNNLTAEKTVPNFLDYIYAGALKSVKPGAVRIAGE